MKVNDIGFIQYKSPMHRDGHFMLVPKHGANQYKYLITDGNHSKIVDLTKK